MIGARWVWVLVCVRLFATTTASGSHEPVERDRNPPLGGVSGKGSGGRVETHLGDEDLLDDPVPLGSMLHDEADEMNSRRGPAEIGCPAEQIAHSGDGGWQWVGRGGDHNPGVVDALYVDLGTRDSRCPAVDEVSVDVLGSDGGLEDPVGEH